MARGYYGNFKLDIRFFFFSFFIGHRGHLSLKRDRPAWVDGRTLQKTKPLRHWSAENGPWGVGPSSSAIHR